MHKVYYICVDNDAAVMMRWKITVHFEIASSFYARKNVGRNRN